MKFKTAISLVLIAVIVLLFAGCNDANKTVEEEYGINNCSVVYFENGSVEFKNRGKNTNEKTVYELASNGKTIAAYTALSMVDEGVLSLDEKIAPYLDDELITDDERINDITLKQLLSHTAGFSPNYEIVTDKKIYSDPGDKFCYSGVGYIYLQNVIENASGLTMDQAAYNYVFEPLGMNNSTFESVPTVTPYMNPGSAVLYALGMFVISFVVLIVLSLIIGKVTEFKLFSFRSAFLASFVLAGVINAAFLLFVFVSKVFVLFAVCFMLMGIVLRISTGTKFFYASVPVIMGLIAAVGFILPVNIPVTNDIVARDANCAYTFRSTAEDMSLFCSELMDRAKDQDDFYNIMFQPAVEIDEENEWGLGIAVEHEGSETTYWHSGINPGFQSLYVLNPEEDKYVIVLTNSDNGLDYSKDLARDYLGVEGVWDIKRG